MSHGKAASDGLRGMAKMSLKRARTVVMSLALSLGACEDAGDASMMAMEGNARPTSGPLVPASPPPIAPEVAMPLAPGAGQPMPAPAAAACERSCAVTGASGCPRISETSRCVASCQQLAGSRCGTEFTAFATCVGSLKTDEIECDEAGAPRPKAGHCEAAFAAAMRCLAGG